MPDSGVTRERCPIVQGAADGADRGAARQHGTQRAFEPTSELTEHGRYCAWRMAYCLSGGSSAMARSTASPSAPPPGSGRLDTGR